MGTDKLCQVYLLESTITELFAEVIQKGQINLQERYVLKAALLNSSLCQEEEILINRLLHAVRRGRLQVVDDL